MLVDLRLQSRHPLFELRRQRGERFATGASAANSKRELSVHRGAPLDHADNLGKRLMSHFREAAQKHGVPLTVCGFGAAFAIHFTERKELVEYRDTLEDDRNRLGAFLHRMAEESFNTLPDRRFYLSVVHTEKDVVETARAIDRIFSWL